MITADQIYSVAAVLLFCLGLHGVITTPQMLRKIIALNIMGSGVFLLFVAVAWRNAGAFADAAPHAMVLTGIVVAVSATAFALGLVRRIDAHDHEEKSGADEVDEEP